MGFLLCELLRLARSERAFRIARTLRERGWIAFGLEAMRVGGDARAARPRVQCRALFLEKRLVQASVDTRAMRLLSVSHAIFAAFFVLAAYVQVRRSGDPMKGRLTDLSKLNDPDYAKWVALYLLASLFSVLGCLNAIPASVPIFYGAFVLYYACTLSAPSYRG